MRGLEIPRREHVNYPPIPHHMRGLEIFNIYWCSLHTTETTKIKLIFF